MATLKLYGTLISPPVRAVLLTLNELSLDFEFIEVDVFSGEQNSEEFIKKNPQHTVPVLQDGDGEFISDSHAIIAYLVRKYGQSDSLYPKDFFRRAVVDQRLHFESGILFARCLKALRSATETVEEKMKNIEEAYELLERFLEGNKYMAGDHLTIADFSILTSTSTLNFVVKIDPSKTPKLHEWLEQMKQLPYYEKANGEGLNLVIEKLKPILLALTKQSQE